MDAKYRLSSRFTTFRGVLKVVGGSSFFLTGRHMIFFIFGCIMGRVRNQNLLFDTVKRREKDTTNSTSSLSLFSYITISDVFLIPLKIDCLFLNQGKLFLFCYSAFTRRRNGFGLSHFSQVLQRKMY